MDNWQKIFSAKLVYRAEIVIAVLQNAGINPVLLNQQDSAYQFGLFEVLVSPDEAFDAIKIITNDIKFE